ncbi:hypothetical protein H6F75_22450 [Nodosilinea sp. FACHB-131]|uniref:hypothetical protein n=1 Tax=Cyanophyceae TaxID=3028117 RepID=UPI0016824EDA|nr:hypothetical protein [Nodosilinea sp. FACHB-131]MBD1876251.1 hypothetical protein [Nodosilinea sp. FACHB-131]
MARRVPSYILADRAAKAKKREDYYANRGSDPSTQNTTVVDLPRINVGYRSLMIQTGATPGPAQVQLLASQTAVNFFEGLSENAVPGAGAVRLGLEYVDLDEFLPVTNFQATKIKAVLGGTKRATYTPWGTRVTRYTKTADGAARNSYTAPLSEKTGAITLEDLRTSAALIKTAVAAALGTNGRLWIEPERENYVI